jgi:hypothetical protein
VSRLYGIEILNDVPKFADFAKRGFQRRQNAGGAECADAATSAQFAKKTRSARDRVSYGALRRSAPALVAGDNAIFDENDAMRILGDIVLVSDQHDGISFCLKAIEDGHDFVSGL